MLKLNDIQFIDNPAARARPDTYREVLVAAPAVLESWKTSLFSFEWLRPDGTIKAAQELSVSEKEKRQTVELKVKNGGAIEKPVLGIGLMDNVEIGIGRAEFLTLASLGLGVIPVHIPLSNESDFKEFLAKVNSQT